MSKKDKIKVGILFGGKSAEHQVSLQSAKNVIDAMDKQQYQPVLIGIDLSGRWRLYNADNFLSNSDNPETIQLNNPGDFVSLVPQSNGRLISETNAMNPILLDVIFPMLHGPFGEDGTIQGLLKIVNVPFVGSSVLGSSIGMDKEIMKRILRDANIPIGKFITIHSTDEKPTFDSIVSKLGPNFFVKPANMGSSVGVRKVHNDFEYQQAMEDAFKFDKKILVEETIVGRELECAILGNNQPQASVIGEVITSHDFYSYQAKYIDSNGSETQIPATISEQQSQQIQQLAIKTFKVLNTEGFGRVDVFLTSTGKVFVNEINTIPGFTKISMYPKLWEASGIQYANLINQLIQLALDRFHKEQCLMTDVRVNELNF
ncbi:D-alanine--D-alanine ligase [Candidatus Marinamargulisbacteria bacterium SCGC AG-410-N11]|nr:D-alanine--D-alanine ligase [Candidatus Marinamargulisbacteria bacterium SCGC AG-410-N11]